MKMSWKKKGTSKSMSLFSSTFWKEKFLPKRWMKITAAVVAVAVAGSSVLIYQLVANAQSATSTTTFRVVQASTGTVEKTVSASGTVSNATQQSLTAPDAGTVDSVSVKAGDTVTKGQTIAHINSTSANATLASKEAALESAKSELASAEADLDSLYITAPLDGRIKSVVVSAGDSSSTINALGYLCYLSTARAMDLTISSPQTSVSQGQSVNVTLSDGSTVSGTVTSVSGGQSGQQSSASSVTVEIGTDTPTVGSTATVKTTSGQTVGSSTLSLKSYYKITLSGASSASTSSGTSDTGTSGGGSTSSSSSITNVYVTENQMVSKNTNLFKTDATSVNSTIQTKEEAVTEAQSDVDTAQAAVDANTITSPVSGTVVSVSVAAGDTVSSGGTIAEVYDPSSMETVVSVDEDDISSVKTGEDAHVTLSAISGKTYSGTVSSVDTIGTNSSGVATFDVTVSISNPDNVLVGMSTSVEIVTKSAKNVVTVPADAILEKQGDTGYVILASSVTDSSGKTKTLTNTNTMELVQKYGKQVTLGLSNDNTVEVKSGLSDGDQVAEPVTINLAAVKSLTSSTSSTDSSSTFGGMGGGMTGGFSSGSMGGGMTGGFSGSTNRRSTTGTGNTTGTASSATTSQSTASTTTTQNTTTTGGTNGGTQ